MMFKMPKVKLSPPLIWTVYLYWCIPWLSPVGQPIRNSWFVKACQVFTPWTFANVTLKITAQGLAVLWSIAPKSSSPQLWGCLKGKVLSLLTQSCRWELRGERSQEALLSPASQCLSHLPAHQAPISLERSICFPNERRVSWPGSQVANTPI